MILPINAFETERVLDYVHFESNKT